MVRDKLVTLRGAAQILGNSYPTTKQWIYKKAFHLICCLLLASQLSGIAAGQELQVAAAADLQFVFQEVSARFQRETGHTVELTFGSSGNFFSQIQNGAPFDVFFSADVDYPAKLEAAGLIEPGTLSQYATGRIALWVRKGSPIDITQGLRTLTDARIRKISIANPEHAPYGRAAVAALRHEKVYDKVRDRLVLGENISQAAQFVESGNADIGILALSLLLTLPLKNEGMYYEIPKSFYPAIDQAVVVLKSSKQKDIARQFLSFLKRPEIAEFMRSSGLTVPESQPGQRKATP
jgi:molybdate transport system substrate-binding protein